MKVFATWGLKADRATSRYESSQKSPHIHTLVINLLYENFPLFPLCITGIYDLSNVIMTFI